MEKVSIIVPIYNVEKYIRRCLESIVKQDYGSFEIICVDDCGQDKSMEIVTEFQKKYPDKLVIVHNPVNKGLGAARDAGMKAASGEYIGFIDSDDYIKPDFISRYIEAFRSSLSDVVAGGYIRDENGKYTELPSDVEDAEAIWVNVSACLKMYRRSFLEKHHLNFNGVRRYEDEGFMYRILMKNPKVKVIPYSGYYYWLNTESITRSKNNDRAGIFLEYASNVEEVSSKHGKYVGMVSRRNLLGIKRRQLCLVDHNEISQAVDNIESAEILEIIDHHRIGSLQTMAPVYFRNQPVGCTATILYQVYQEKNLTIEPNIAGLLCSAILSDTLMFRSPTCTAMDKAAAEKLAEIAGVKCEELASEMFAAGSNLKNKSPEEIFYQDFKKFELNKSSFGVGQITSVNEDELTEIKKELLPYMEKALGSHGESMLFFMLTDIINESTELLFYGGDSKNVVSEAFHKEPQEGEQSVILPGVVSRKKQLIPSFMTAMQQ